jgi:2,5-furandicarboxylate decarboxylase 1
VLWALAMRFQADRDLVIIPNIIGSHLNPTAYGYNRLERGAMETKLIFDATKPLPPYDFPKEAQVPAEVLEKIDLARDARPYEPGKDDKLITGEE